MLDATTEIRRTAALAAALGAVAAPGASGRVPDAPPVLPPAATAARAAEPGAASTLADLAAHREAIAARAWRAANPPTIIEVSSADGGFDLTSAGIGAAVPLTLVLLEVAGRWVLRRRRDTEVQQQLA